MFEAAIINVIVLFTVAVADRAIEIIVRNFAASSLKTRKRAPIVHDSDTWLPNLPRSLFKYYRYPAILLTILCTILLIASELISEIGVDVSVTCKPIKQRDSVITPGDISGRVTIVEKGASAFLLQNLTFFDGPLTRVPAGLPRRIRGNECLSCMDKDKSTYPDIVNNCTVRRSQVYEAGELKIGVDGSGNSPFGNVTIGFKELSGDENEFRVNVNETVLNGDITYNGANYAAFIFYTASSKSTDEVTYFEYFGQEHIPTLIMTMQKREPPDMRQIWEPTQTEVSTWKIKCQINELSQKNFQTALSVYRTIQLENPVNPAMYDESTMRFAQMKEEDVYRAALSIKVIDDSYSDGEYFMYTTCGVYHWRYIIPMVVCLVLVLALGIVSLFLSPDKSLVQTIPYNSRTWFRHARKYESDEEEYDPETPSLRERYMRCATHEMFLLECSEIPGAVPGAVPRIVLRSKEMRYAKEKENAEPSRLPSEPRYSW